MADSPLIKIRQLRADSENFSESLQQLRQLPQQEDVQKKVAAILSRVQKEGDAALLELTAEFDGVTANTVADLQVSPQVMNAALKQIPSSLLTALRDMAERVRNYHARQKPQSWQMEDADGNTVGERFLPVSRAAIYAPGGRAVYPSSVLMGILPAKIADVGEVILVTPPQKNNDSWLPDPVVLAAAAIGGADGILLLGGAQAAAAIAYGTKTIPRADVFAGPGNVYLTEAKRQLSNHIGIDSLAGPSEVLIVADASANPIWVAADMLAQAEHDPQAQSIVVSDSESLLAAVLSALSTQLSQAARAPIIKQSLENRGALILAKDITACCQVANTIAAEHVQVMCENADAVAAQIRHVGGLFIGAYSCTALGDYGAGPNHVLPTNGTPRFASPLGVHHFQKRTGWLKASRNGVNGLAKTAATIAESESLPAHAHSATLRIIE